MKRLLSLALALILALSAVSLIACGTKQPSVPDNTPAAPSEDGKNEPAAPSAEQTAAQLLATFPTRDYGGEEFLVMAASNFEGRFPTEQFTNDDKINGSIVHDALFERDRMLEAHFGISIHYDDVLDSQMYGKTAASIQAGDDTYSLILGGLSGAGLSFMKNELLYDLNTIDTLDLSNTWWNKNSVETFTINDICYMATGAITNRSVYAPYAVLFNNRLLEACMLDSPYELVEDDEWTLEMLEFMILGTSYEINANDKMEPDDFYGMAPSSDSEFGLLFGLGCHLSEITDDGELIAVYEQESNFDLISYLTDFYALEDVLYYKQTYDSSDAFEQGRAVFHALPMIDITLIDTEDTYGIVPMPKYSDDQEEYVSITNKFINTMALLPTSIRDNDKVGEIVEALCAVSLYTSLDKQYETVMLNRQAQDAQSKKYLQMVVASSAYDWVYILNPAGLYDSIKSAIRNGGELASTFAAVRDQVDAELESFMELYQ